MTHSSWIVTSTCHRCSNRSWLNCEITYFYLYRWHTNRSKFFFCMSVPVAQINCNWSQSKKNIASDLLMSNQTFWIAQWNIFWDLLVSTQTFCLGYWITKCGCQKPHSHTDSFRTQAFWHLHCASWVEQEWWHNERFYSSTIFLTFCTLHKKSDLLNSDNSGASVLSHWW